MDNCISLVIVNYNAGHMLARCIESAHDQVSEIVIVDNASNDSSLEECIELFSSKPQVKFIRNKHNLGFAASCNIGFSEATYNVVLFLNPDCFLHSNAVAEMQLILESDATIGMVGGLLVDQNGSELGGCRRSVPTPWRSFVRVFGLYKLEDYWPNLFYDFHLHNKPLSEEAVEVDAISGACMMVKRQAVEDVGLWDEGYFLHCEDLDWCMRFRSRGWKILFVPSARITHIVGFCSRNRPLFVERHKHKGMIRFYRKFFKQNYPLGMTWLVYLSVWVRFSFVLLRKLVGLGKLKLLNIKEKKEINVEDSN